MSFDFLRKEFILILLISLAIYGGNRLWINWTLNQCEALKFFGLIVLSTGFAVTLFLSDIRFRGGKGGGGNPNQQGQGGGFRQ